jgi:hypothetical protein
MLLAVTHVPTDPEAWRRAASAADLPLADLKLRLAGTLPRVLAPAVAAERGAALAADLGALGFRVVTFDVAAIPSDDDRVVARAVELARDTLIVTDPRGEIHRCPGRTIDLLQRGTRITRGLSSETAIERKLSVGKALLTGGLSVTSKVTRTTTRVTEAAEPFLLIQRSDGEPDVILYERRTDYHRMGTQMDPSSKANFERLWSWLRDLAPPGAVDDRVSQPAFVAGLPALASDPVDLALFLVTLSRR